MNNRDGSRVKVLVIGWDAADWKVIQPLMDKGAMPNLTRLVEEGAMGEISTLHPVLSPMLWTSIATGKRAFQHGICGFIEPTPDGMGVQPISNLSRRTKAVWNILNQNDLKSIVVGWWPSHPAEPINGVMVSNNYHRANSLNLEAPWPLAKGTVHPQHLGEALSEVRLHPCEVTEDLLLPFIPRASEVDQEKDRRLWNCAKTIAECTSIHGAATHLMETQDWDFAAIYYDAIDHFSHGFMKYHPPRRDHVPEKDFEIFQHVVQCGYVYHDMMLGKLLELAGDDASIILLSDHGFHPDHLRPSQIPAEPTGPAIEHRDFGIFVMKGPGIKKDELIHGVSLLDVAPTVLTLFGLPVGADMDGRVVTDAFEESFEIDEIPSWDDVQGDDGQHSKDRQLDAFESQEALQQLVDLGYVEPLDENREKNVDRAVRELSFNAARAYMDAHRYGDAVELLHELYSKHPSEYRYGIQLAMCFKALNRTDDLDRLVSNLEKQRISDARKAQVELEKYKRIAAERRAARDHEAAANESFKDPEIGDNHSNGKSRDADSHPGAPNDDQIFSPAEQLKISRLIGLAKVNTYSLQFLGGFAKVAQGDFEEGIRQLEAAAIAQPGLPGLHIQIGDAYLKTKQWGEAQAAFRQAFEIDSQNPFALLGLARCHLGKRENRRAIERGLQSVGQMFFNPMAHYYLAVAFHRIGKTEQAVEALKLSISQNPNNARAHGRLGYIYKREYGDLAQARKHFKLAAQCRDATKRLRVEAKQYDIAPFDHANDDVLHDLRAPDSQPTVTAGSELLLTLQHSTFEDTRPDSNDEDPFVTIVTGLPRSGTSMMMQMLASGGIPVLSDGNRVADEDNPKGYFELQQAKGLATNNRWVEQARGKVVKVVAQLVPYLPKQFNYRVIFMHRPLEEVLASQQIMLRRGGQRGANINPDRLRDVFAGQLKTCIETLHRNRVATFRAPYSQAVADPLTFAAKLKEFLGLDLDVERMAASVDPSLYRQKKEASQQAK